MARRDVLQPKAEYIAADLSIAPKLFPCSRAADHTITLLTGQHLSRARFCISSAIGARIKTPTGKLDATIISWGKGETVFRIRGVMHLMCLATLSNTLRSCAVLSNPLLFLQSSGQAP
jgi:hypothetical protein